MHLANAFIQSDKHCIQSKHFISVHALPGNQTPWPMHRCSRMLFEMQEPKKIVLLWCWNWEES